MRPFSLRFGFDKNTVLDNGGHSHGGARPTGTYSRSQVRTDANGDASTQYTASAFGGTTRFTVDDPSENHYGDIHVEVPFLQELVARDNFRLIGSNTAHPSNHWGTAAADIGLKNIADDYETKFYLDGWPAPPQGTAIDAGDAATDYYKPHYNDQSLQDGGKFDLGENFATNGHHDEHRIGINCDVRIRNIPTDKRDDLTQIFTDEGSTRTLLEGNPPHWHLRFEFGNQQAQITTNTPFSGTPVTVPGQIEAEQFDIGDAGTAFNVPDPYFNDDKGGANVGVYTASNGTTTYVGSTMGGEWLNYTVNVISSGSYSFSTQVASPNGGSTFHFEVDGVDKTGPLYMPNTGSWEAFQLVTADDIWLDAGQHNLRLVVDGAGLNAGNFDYFFITPYTPPSSCQPTASQLGACQHVGGVWDYDACDCDSSGGGCGYYNCY
jgi:hypothetical protein